MENKSLSVAVNLSLLSADFLETSDEKKGTTTLFKGKTSLLTFGTKSLGTSSSNVMKGLLPLPLAAYILCVKTTKSLRKSFLNTVSRKVALMFQWHRLR